MRPLLIWIVSGFVVGWTVRVVMQSRRDFGILGDVILGLLGAVTGGWLFRHLGVIAPTGGIGHVFVAVVGASAVVASLRVLRRFVYAGITTLPGIRTADADLGTQLSRLTELERRVLAGILGRTPTTEDPNRRFDEQLTFGERVADRVASFGGSWTFIGLFGVTVLLWMIANAESTAPFDPYPFILLNLALSCIAALQAPVIMMSQNRMADKDRLDAHTDYQVNLRAEMEIMRLHGKLDAAVGRELADFLAIQRQQLEALQRIEARLLGPAEAGATALQDV